MNSRQAFGLRADPSALRRLRGTQALLDGREYPLATRSKIVSILENFPSHRCLRLSLRIANHFSLNHLVAHQILKLRLLR